MFSRYTKLFVARNKIFFVSSQKRFISDADVLKNLKTTTHVVARVSKYDPNVKQVLPMIEKGRYIDAKNFVKQNKIDIDSHDRWENTPLTDAAMRGDVKAIRFLINELGANPHASCDCPYHKTALHYASENGHYEAVKVLLECGAKPNELDSRRYTALDVAKTKDIAKLLESRSGVSGKEVPAHVGQKLNLPKANCVHQLKLK